MVLPRLSHDACVQLGLENDFWFRLQKQVKALPALKRQVFAAGGGQRSARSQGAAPRTLVRGTGMPFAGLQHQRQRSLPFP